MIFRDFFIKSSWLKLISVLLIISSEASAESKTIYIDSNATMNLNNQDLTKLLTQDTNNISKNPNSKTLPTIPLPLAITSDSKIDNKISIPIPPKQEKVEVTPLAPKVQEEKEEKEIDITKSSVSTSNIAIPIPPKQEKIEVTPLAPKVQEEKEEKEIDITKPSVSTSNIAIPIPPKQEKVEVTPSAPKVHEKKVEHITSNNHSVSEHKTQSKLDHKPEHKVDHKKHEAQHIHKTKQDDAIEEEVIIEEMMLDTDLYNRPIYDHNTVVLPPQISKKQYGENNRHLPKVFYQQEYTDLLFSSVKSDDIQGIKSLVQKGANINAQEVSTGYTPVMYAIKFNKIKALRALIMHGADLQKTNLDGQTALHIATLLGNAQAVEVLLSAGIDPTIRDKKGNRASEYMKTHMKKTATVMAANYQDINKALIDFVGLSTYGAVQYALQNGANVNVKDDVGADGDTPLIIAIKCQDIKMISLLLNHGASLNVKNNKNKTPMQVAKEVKNSEIIGILRTVKINREIELVEKN